MWYFLLGIEIEPGQLRPSQVDIHEIDGRGSSHTIYRHRCSPTLLIKSSEFLVTITRVGSQLMKNGAARIAFLFAFAAACARAQGSATYAQKVVEEVKAVHPEITGLELAGIKSGKDCQTIAATEIAEIGQKCDKDELSARKTNRPYVEQEKTEFDVTLPIHDSDGNVIATAGMDFKLEAGRTKETVVREALKVGSELERKLTSESDLFRPAR